MWLTHSRKSVLNYFPKSSKWMVFFSVVVLFSGCTSYKSQKEVSFSPQVQAILDGDLIMGHKVQLSELPQVDLTAISPEMAAYADKAVATQAEDIDKVIALHIALMKSVKGGGLGLKYSRYATIPPIEAFNSRQANCLSYALLFTAMAKHIGLRAYMNDVHVPPTWDMRDDNSLVFLRHVNVKVRLRNGKILIRSEDEMVVDLEMRLYKPYYAQEEISDAIVAAQFYSNRAMEYEGQQDYKNAFLYLRKAISENSQQSYVWNNLASVFSRLGHNREAEMLYLHALEVNAKDLVVMSNLAALYGKMNLPTEADAYKKLTEKHRTQNPYYQFFSAYKAFEIKDYENALTLIHKSIRMENKEPRFYDLASKIYLQLGRTDSARTMQKKYDALMKTANLE